MVSLGHSLHQDLPRSLPRIFQMAARGRCDSHDHDYTYAPIQGLDGLFSTVSRSSPTAGGDTSLGFSNLRCHNLLRSLVVDDLLCGLPHKRSSVAQDVMWRWDHPSTILGWRTASSATEPALPPCQPSLHFATTRCPSLQVPFGGILRLADPPTSGPAVGALREHLRFVARPGWTVTEVAT